MSKKGLTEIVCVLDRSGSMMSIIDDAIGGFNSFLKSQQDLDGDEARISIVMFDDQYDMIHKSVPITEVQAFTRETYVPRGCTALNDAIGRTIMGIGEIFTKRDDSEKPEKVIFVILTDGAENTSTEYTQDQIKALVKQQEDEWKWEFIFLSSDINAFQQGASLGFTRSSKLGKSGNSCKHAYCATSDAISSYRTNGVVSNIAKEIDVK